MGKPSLDLITIPFSHYCDKARWALERSGLAFTERAYLPMFHWAPGFLGGGGRTVPILRTPDGVFSDSTDILHYVDGRIPEARRLFPATDPAVRLQVDRWEERLDAHFGPAARRWAYDLLLPNRAWTTEVLARTVSPAQGAALRVVYPAAVALLRKGLKITPAGVARSEAKLREIFDAVAETLSDGRPYLTGDRFTAADLTFAALAAPLVFPEGYARFLADFEALPPAAAERLRPWREAPAGEFARRVFRDHRDERPA